MSGKSSRICFLGLKKNQPSELNLETRKHEINVTLSSKTPFYVSDMIDPVDLGHDLPSASGTRTVKVCLTPASFPFMKLPPELRNRIYKLAVDSKPQCIIDIRNMVAGKPMRVRTPRSELRGAWSLFHMQRQVGIEARSWVYGTMHFHFETLNSLHDFLKIIGSNLPSLRRITCRINPSAKNRFKDIMKMLQDAINLESLSFTASTDVTLLQTMGVSKFNKRVPDTEKMKPIIEFLAFVAVRKRNIQAAFDMLNLTARSIAMKDHSKLVGPFAPQVPRMPGSLHWLRVELKTQVLREVRGLR